jgi:hypothetical protein
VVVVVVVVVVQRPGIVLCMYVCMYVWRVHNKSVEKMAGRSNGKTIVS